MALVFHPADVASGAGLIAAGCAGFWYLLPRQGRIHPLTEKWDGGQMLTIAIMTAVTIGFAILIDGVFD
jgi:hypothetical protein